MACQLHQASHLVVLKIKMNRCGTLFLIFSSNVVIDESVLNDLKAILG